MLHHHATAFSSCFAFPFPLWMMHSPRLVSTFSPHLWEKETRKNNGKKRKTLSATTHTVNSPTKKAMSIVEWYSKQKKNGVLSADDIPFLAQQLLQRPSLSFSSLSSSGAIPNTSIRIGSRRPSAAPSPLEQIACVALGAGECTFSEPFKAFSTSASHLGERSILDFTEEFNRDLFFSLTVKEKEELAVLFLFRLGKVPLGLSANDIFDALLDAPHISVIPRFLQETLFADPALLAHVHPRFLKRCFELAVSPSSDESDSTSRERKACPRVSSQQERAKLWIAWGEQYVPSHQERCVVLRSAGLWYEVLAYEHYLASCSPSLLRFRWLSSLEEVPRGRSTTVGALEAVRHPSRRTTFYRQLLCNPMGWGLLPCREGRGQQTERGTMFHQGFGDEMVSLLSNPGFLTDSLLSRALRGMPAIILDFSLHLLLLSWARYTRISNAVHDPHDEMPSFPRGAVCSSPKETAPSGKKERQAAYPVDGLPPTPPRLLAHIIEGNQLADESLPSSLPERLLMRTGSSSRSSHSFPLPLWLIQHGYFTHQQLLYTLHFDLYEGSSWTTQDLLGDCKDRASIATLMGLARDPGMPTCWKALRHWLHLFPDDTAYVLLTLPAAGECTSASGYSPVSQGRPTTCKGRRERKKGCPKTTVMIQVVPSIPTAADGNGVPRMGGTTSLRSPLAASLEEEQWDFSPRDGNTDTPRTTPLLLAPPTSMAAAISTAAAVASSAVSTLLLPPPSGRKPLLWGGGHYRWGTHKGVLHDRKHMLAILRTMPSLTSDVIGGCMALLLQKPPMSSSSSWVKDDATWESERISKGNAKRKEGIGSVQSSCRRTKGGPPVIVDPQDVLDLLIIAVERRIALPNNDMLVEVLLSLAACETPSLLSPSHSEVTFSPVLRCREFSSPVEMERGTRQHKDRQTDVLTENAIRKTWEALKVAVTLPYASPSSSSSTSPLLKVAQLYQQHLLPQDSEEVFRMSIVRAWKVYEKELEEEWSAMKINEKEEAREQNEFDPLQGYFMPSRLYFAFYASASPLVLGRLLQVSFHCGFFSGPAKFLSYLSSSSILFSTMDYHEPLPGVSPTSPSSSPSSSLYASSVSSLQRQVHLVSPFAVVKVWRDVVHDMLRQALFTSQGGRMSLKANTSTDSRCSYGNPPPHHACGVEVAETKEQQEADEDRMTSMPSSVSSHVMSLASLHALVQLLEGVSPSFVWRKPTQEGVKDVGEEDAQRFPVEMEVFLYSASAVTPCASQVPDGRRNYVSESAKECPNVLPLTSSCCCSWFSSRNRTLHFPFTPPPSVPLPQCPANAAVSSSSLLDCCFSPMMNFPTATPFPSAMGCTRSAGSDYTDLFPMMQSVTHHLYHRCMVLLWPLALQEVCHWYHQWVQASERWRQDTTMRKISSARPCEKTEPMPLCRDSWEALHDGILNEERSAFLHFSLKLIQEIHKAVRLACVGVGYEAPPLSFDNGITALHLEANKEEGCLPPLPTSLRTILSSAEEWLTELQTFTTSLNASPKSSSHLSLRLRHAQDTMLMWTVFTAGDVLRQRGYYQEAVTWLLPGVDNLPLCLQKLRCRCLEEIRNRGGGRGFSMGTRRRDLNSRSRSSTMKLRSRKKEKEKCEPHPLSFPFQSKKKSMAQNELDGRVSGKEKSELEEQWSGNRKGRGRHHNLIRQRGGSTKGGAGIRREFPSHALAIPTGCTNNGKRRRARNDGPRILDTLLAQLSEAGIR